MLDPDFSRIKAAAKTTVQDAVAAGKADVTSAEAAGESWLRRHKVIVAVIAAALLIALGAALGLHGVR